MCFTDFILGTGLTIKSNLVDIPALRGFLLTAAHSGPHHPLGSPAKVDQSIERPTFFVL